MNKIILIASGLAFAGAAIASSTNQGLGVVIVMGFVGGVLLIVGLAGGK